MYIWNTLLSRQAALSQSYLRDFAQTYLEHTAFRLFSHHPVSINSFFKSTIVTSIAITLLFVVYCHVNSVSPGDYFSISSALLTLMAIGGVIGVDYFSIVQTLYIMRYARMASHFADLVFLFVVDVILTANLFSFVYAASLTIMMFVLLYVPHHFVVYIDAKAVTQPDSESSPQDTDMFEPATAQKLGFLAGRATVVVLNRNARFRYGNVKFLSKKISADNFAAAVFDLCTRKPSESDMATYATYECEMTASHATRMLDDIPYAIFSTYIVSYDLATMGQRSFLSLMQLKKIELYLSNWS